MEKTELIRREDVKVSINELIEYFNSLKYSNKNELDYYEIINEVDNLFDGKYVELGFDRIYKI